MMPKVCKWRRHLLLSVLLTCVAIGCGRGNPLNRQPIAGKVELEGKPLFAGYIEFEAANFMSGAPINNGTYRVTPEKGMPPGEYLVRIHAASSAQKGPGADSNSLPGDVVATHEIIPAEFNDKSELKCVVEAGKENVFDFTIPHARK